jgi:hypothetical protein
VKLPRGLLVADGTLWEALAMSGASGHPHRRTSTMWWLWIAAAVLASVGILLGSIRHSEGLSGRGGAECGSVWFVVSYHSGCESWLDAMNQAVFIFLGASVGTVAAGLVGRRRGWTVAAVVGIALGFAVAVLGPRLWSDNVMSNFGY